MTRHLRRSDHTAGSRASSLNMRRINKTYLAIKTGGLTSADIKSENVWARPTNLLLSGRLDGYN